MNFNLSCLYNEEIKVHFPCLNALRRTIIEGEGRWPSRERWAINHFVYKTEKAWGHCSISCA